MSTFFGSQGRTVRVRGYSPLDHFSGPEFNANRLSEEAAYSMPPQMFAVLVLAAFIFAAGLFGGMLLFGPRAQEAPIVITCPAPGVQVAARPAECGPGTPQVVTR